MQYPSRSYIPTVKDRETGSKNQDSCPSICIIALTKLQNDAKKLSTKFKTTHGGDGGSARSLLKLEEHWLCCLSLSPDCTLHILPYRLGICVYKPETNCQTMTCSPPLTKVLPLQLDPLDGKIKEITPRKSPLIGYPIPSGQL